MDSRTKQMTRAMALDSAVRRVAASSRFYETHEILELAETFVDYIENGVDYDAPTTGES